MKRYKENLRYPKEGMGKGYIFPSAPAVLFWQSHDFDFAMIRFAPILFEIAPVVSLLEYCKETIRFREAYKVKNGLVTHRNAHSKK